MQPVSYVIAVEPNLGSFDTHRFSLKFSTFIFHHCNGIIWYTLILFEIFFIYFYFSSVEPNLGSFDAHHALMLWYHLSPQSHRQRCHSVQSVSPQTSWSGGSCGSSHSWRGCRQWQWQMWPEDSLSVERVAIGFLWGVAGSSPSVACTVWNVHMPWKIVTKSSGMLTQPPSTPDQILKRKNIPCIRTSNHWVGYLDPKKRIRSPLARCLLCLPCKGDCRSPKKSVKSL